MAGGIRVPDTNVTIITGRLGRDAELKQTTDGTPYTRFSIANTRHYRKSDGNKGEDTTWVNVVVWDKMAGWVPTLAKGRPVLVEGSLTSYEIQDKDTGKTRGMLEIRAHRVSPLDWDTEPGADGGHAVEPKPSAQATLPAQAAPPSVPDDDRPF